MLRDRYRAYLATKSLTASASGIAPKKMPAHMTGPFAFQADVTDFCLRMGRAAAFLDTGLGKTSVELEFSRQAAQHYDAPALIMTPLSVASQIEAEGRKRGYDIRAIRDGSQVRPGINIINYDRLSLLDVSVFCSVALDESSILKSFMGSTTRALIAAFQSTPMRLCATATPAPNDFTEIGNHCEFLGIMSRSEMLARWFINDGERSNQWRLKGHAHGDFWRWMASWARMAESPEDLGYDGSLFRLEPMRVIKAATIGSIKPLAAPKAHGFFNAAISATNLHTVKRDTIAARSAAVESIIKTDPEKSWIVWVDTDYEADAVKAKLPAAIELRGSQSIDEKETTLASFLSGKVRWIITKPRIAGFGLNWQHCHNMIFVGRSFSYEYFYQAVRRCWRFGQKSIVNVYLIVAEGEDQIGDVIDRKSDDHRRMKREMAKAMQFVRESGQSRRLDYDPKFDGKVPEWLKTLDA